jgi:molybdenum cofactor guanylyltransferase
LKTPFFRKIMKKHQKHTNLVRPTLGNFGRTELAFVGAPCGSIETLVYQLIETLASRYTIVYADASHHAPTLPTSLASGAWAEYSDCIDYQTFVQRNKPTMFQLRQQYNEADAIFINGNHHEGKAQIVFIDERKKASLQKRLSQLTDIQLFITVEKEGEIFDFLKESHPNWSNIPVLSLSELEKISALVEKFLLQQRPILNGLVLAGGKSLRMGQDKGAMVWHNNQTQREYVADLLHQYCSEVFISCRKEQVAEFAPSYPTLPDTFEELGPYGAILSAFRTQPNSAWLVVACDLPLLDATTLEQLVAGRNPSSIATTFESPFDGLPEPLITIWEPKSYPILLEFLAQGYSCPRKVLRNNSITLLHAQQPDALKNVNTPTEMEEVKNNL